MKYLLLVCAALALLTTGCGEETVVQDISTFEKVEIVEVDKDALASVLATNDLTLIDFTATW